MSIIAPNEEGIPTQAIDINKTSAITCVKCGNHTFERVVLLRKLSAIASPTGEQAIIPIPLFACNACGGVNPEFLPRQDSGLSKGV